RAGSRRGAVAPVDRGCVLARGRTGVRIGERRHLPVEGAALGGAHRLAGGRDRRVAPRRARESSWGARGGGADHGGGEAQSRAESGGTGCRGRTARGGGSAGGG